MPYQRSYIIVVVFIIILFATQIFLPQILTALHHYTNFIAVGRSTIKTFGMLAWILLTLLIPFLKKRINQTHIQKVFALTLIGTILIATIPTLLSLTLTLKYNLPLKTVIYAVHNTTFSFNQLAHSHLLKPVLSFLAFVNPDAELGQAWIFAIENEFNLPLPAIYFWYASLFIILFVFAFIALLNSLRYESFMTKLLYGIATFSIFKSVIDGGFLSPDLLISLIVVFIFLGRTRLVAIPFIFLVFDYFIWFTDDYLIKNSLYLALIAALFLLQNNFKNRLMKISGYVIGTLLLITFFYAGANIQFFGRSFNASINSTIPPNKDVYFLKRGALFPQQISLDKEMAAQEFIKKYNTDFEYEDVSIKISDVNCDRTFFQPILYRFRVLGDDLKKIKRQVMLAGWYMSDVINVREGSYIALRPNNCMPNRFSQSLYFIKKILFPTKSAILVWLG
ncbi:hypothetical protein HY967_05130 [Candidatus Jorgensenbacteria bacterium]|nr:hypothetical protein [Candidatus Jorgensenbacteria bacterium]